jgi:hypothetical protein
MSSAASFVLKKHLAAESKDSSLMRFNRYHEHVRSDIGFER